MNRKIKSFVDELIRENADKSFPYQLQLSCDLNEKQKDQLINEILKSDQESIKEVLLDYAQTLVDERIDLVEAEDRYDSGLRSRIDRINGETTWHLGAI